MNCSVEHIAARETNGTNEHERDPDRFSREKSARHLFHLSRLFLGVDPSRESGKKKMYYIARKGRDFI